MELELDDTAILAATVQYKLGPDGYERSRQLAEELKLDLRTEGAWRTLEALVAWL